MQLGFFTEEAYTDLLNDIPENAIRYYDEEMWLSDYFGDKKYYLISNSVGVNKFIPSYTPGKKSDSQKTEEDLINTRLLHDAFINLTPLQASNKYMWTYLCHQIPEYYEYIRDRWLQEKKEKTIKTRFFVTTSDSLRNDNALSRLWWYGHLTYDRSNPNPYALTEILLTNQTICTDVMDTYNRMNPTRMKGVLLGIKDFKEYMGTTERLSDYFRECKKYLNHYAAVTSLDFLNSEEIRDLTFSRMVRLKEEGF